MEYNLKIPFGLRDGDLINISEITEQFNGRKCNCVCPSCGDKLEARTLGTKVRPYFSHITKNCGMGFETALHLFVKQTLEKNKTIKIPAIHSFVLGSYRKVKDSVYFNFDEIRLEQRIGQIIPDIVLSKGNLQLLIEVGVTHYIDNEKEKKIRELRKSCIELDMNYFDTDYYNFDKEKLEYEIIHNTDFKHWIHSNLEVDYRKKKIEEHNEKIRHEGEKEKAKLERISYLSSKEGQNKIIDKLYEDIITNSVWRKVSQNLKININNVPYYMNTPINGELVFDVHRIVWQSSIFNSWIYKRLSASGKTLVSVQAVTKWTKSSGLKLNKDLIYNERIGMKAIAPGLSDVIAEYLNYLCTYGYLEMTEQTKRTATINNRYYWFFERVREDIDIYPEEYNNERFKLIGDSIINVESGEIVDI